MKAGEPVVNNISLFDDFKEKKYHFILNLAMKYIPVCAKLLGKKKQSIAEGIHVKLHSTCHNLSCVIFYYLMF